MPDGICCNGNSQKEKVFTKKMFMVSRQKAPEVSAPELFYRTFILSCRFLYINNDVFRGAFEDKAYSGKDIRGDSFHPSVIPLIYDLKTRVDGTGQRVSADRLFFHQFFQSDFYVSVIF